MPVIDNLFPVQNIDGMDIASDEDVFETVFLREIRRIFDTVLANMPRMEAEVVRYYYFEDMNMPEIAEKLSYTVARISQLHSQALKSLRESVTTI